MSLDERAVVARVERVTLRDLRLWVREGWVRPSIGEAGPVFDELDIARVRLLCDLRKDMALPHDALPVVLGLIDRMHAVRKDLLCMAEALGAESVETRNAVLSRFRRLRGDDDA
ncbi:hypothetical protein HKCCE3408_08250 [Rhodobacterales bacterium HKCCE3408]|nr:hypothetical protein [Rhodobacterales bacterium HKCCE3408]